MLVGGGKLPGDTCLVSAVAHVGTLTAGELHLHCLVGEAAPHQVSGESNAAAAIGRANRRLETGQLLHRSASLFNSRASSESGIGSYSSSMGSINGAIEERSSVNSLNRRARTYSSKTVQPTRLRMPGEERHKEPQELPLADGSLGSTIWYLFRLINMTGSLHRA